MPNLLDKFLNETKIPENYDPNNDRETGYYSRAFKDKYIEWLEDAIKAERNECALIVENQRKQINGVGDEIYYLGKCIEAIRARG